jgi:hypothetical protein
MILNVQGAANASGTSAGDVLALLASLATIVAAIIAAVALLSARNQAREATRPYVVPELTPHPLFKQQADFTVTNYGLTAAYDLAVTFDRDPLTDSDDGVAAVFMERYKQTFHSLAPRRSLRNVYWRFSGSGEDGNEFDLPPHVQVTVTYNGQARGFLRRQDKFAETFDLTIDMIRGETRTSRTTKNKEMDRIAAALEAIVEGQN